MRAGGRHALSLYNTIQHTHTHTQMYSLSFVIFFFWRGEGRSLLREYSYKSKQTHYSGGKRVASFSVNGGFTSFPNTMGTHTHTHWQRWER